MEKMDARKRYTQMVLKQSFLKLLKEKPVNRITVKEVCAPAQLNRATFYAHYSDCFALMESIENELIDAFEKSLRYGKRCGFSKRYFLVLVACRHLTCTKTECRKMFLSLIAPLTTIRLNRGKRSNRLPYIFAQGQER